MIVIIIILVIVFVGILVFDWVFFLFFDGIVDLLEFLGVVSGGVLVLIEKIIRVSDVVGFVVKGFVEGIKVEFVVLFVNEFEVWLLMVVGWIVVGVLVFFCVDSGVGVGDRDFKRLKDILLKKNND